MLILTRRVGETLIIGEGKDRVEVRIQSTYGNQVKVGIKAPKDVPVHREEVYEKIHRHKAIA